MVCSTKFTLRGDYPKVVGIFGYRGECGALDLMAPVGSNGGRSEGEGDSTR